MKAVLVLEDGSVWPGEGFGAFAKVSGEVVFNTGMVGYPESITDPSYHGQILCQTYPLIGNYGVSVQELRVRQARRSGAISSAKSATGPSHATSEKTLDAWLKENGIPGISGVDTRALTKKLRVHGVMLGILETYFTKVDLGSLRREARLIPDPNKRHLVAEVTTKKIKIYNKDCPKTVVLIDCGVEAEHPPGLAPPERARRPRPGRDRLRQDHGLRARRASSSPTARAIPSSARRRSPRSAA